MRQYNINKTEQVQRQAVHNAHSRRRGDSTVEWRRVGGVN